MRKFLKYSDTVVDPHPETAANDAGPDDPQQVNKTLKWYRGATYGGYIPHLVRAISRDGSKFVFRFIDADKGELVNKKDYPVDLDDVTSVYPGQPSRIPTAAEIAAGKVIAVAMLHPDGMSEDMKQAAAPAAAEGKWPIAAAAYRKLITELIARRGFIDLLTQSEREFLLNQGFHLPLLHPL